MDSSTFLPGPSVCGLYGYFEEDFGDPDTRSPYARITPSRIGAALLPFHCPRCKQVVDFSTPEQREHYHDTRVLDGKKRDNYFCPSCGNRFFLNMAGQPLNGRVGRDNGTPSIVEELVVGSNGTISIKKTKQATPVLDDYLLDYSHGTDVLGCS